MDLGLPLENVQLVEDSSARNRASASRSLKAGQVIVTTPVLSSALLPSEKGRRCDYCHSLTIPQRSLLKCSSCASYWYCGVECQSKQWRLHHKRICKAYNRYTISPEYQALSSTDRVDAILLSHFIAQVFPAGASSIPTEHEDKQLWMFFDLLKGPMHSRGIPPLCQAKSFPSVSPDVLEECYSRFGNNNFILHSHLNTFAHGVFPLASRLFNHSCVPNCAAKYVLVPGEMAKMEIVALHEINAGDELTIPYLDPALPFQTRQEALLSNYGFECQCILCNFSRSIAPLPPLPDDITPLEAELRAYVSSCQGNMHGTVPLQLSMPSSLYPLLHDTYLPRLSEDFSRNSHDGQYDVAVRTGSTLLALYMVLYPTNFPQIGMHALELAKTAWNGALSADSGDYRDPRRAKELASQAYSSLGVAKEVLSAFGPEGDDGGPLQEVGMLESLLSEDPLLRAP